MCFHYDGPSNTLTMSIQWREALLSILYSLHQSSEELKNKFAFHKNLNEKRGRSKRICLQLVIYYN